MWPFRRRRRAPRHVGPASTDWRAGDVAECVSAKWDQPFAGAPVVGQRFIVSGVSLRCERDIALFTISLCGLPGHWFSVWSFRKVVTVDADARVPRRKRVPEPA